MYSRLFLFSVNVELLPGTAVISSSAFSCCCLADRLSPVRANFDRARSIGERKYAGESLSLFLCLPSFFSRACDYARLRRTVGDRDEGWVVCRDGIAGAPLIYPFTHPC